MLLPAPLKPMKAPIDERFEVVNGQLQETFVAGETVDVTVTETAEDGTVSTEVVSVDIKVESSRTETRTGRGRKPNRCCRHR